MSFISRPLGAAFFAGAMLIGALSPIASLPAQASTLPRLGYAWADLPSSTFYIPSLAFQRNTTSGVNSIGRVGVGNYIVHFPGLATAGGTVDVSAYGSISNSCEVGFWSPVGSEEIVNVRCFAVNGFPADTQFTVAFIDAVASGTVDYVWANQPSSPSYTPDLAHQYNSHGLANTITRTSPGVYHVRIPGDGGMQGNVKVTPNGLDGHTCSVIHFGTLSSDQVVDVICFSATGNPSDTRFTLTYANHADLAGDQALPFGYAWDTKPGQSIFFPPINFAYSNGVAAGPITRLGPGHWSVTLPKTNSIIGGGDVQVSAGFAGAADRCQVEGWNADRLGATVVNVACENTQSGPADVPFIVSFFH